MASAIDAFLSPIACFCTGRCRQMGFCPNQPFSPAGLPRPTDGKGYVLRHTRDMTREDLGLPETTYHFWLGQEGG